MEIQIRAQRLHDLQETLARDVAHLSELRLSWVAQHVGEDLEQSVRAVGDVHGVVVLCAKKVQNIELL